MLELSMPKIRTDHRLAAEFRPRKVEPWLERLPRTDRDTCCRQLRKALAAQNRLALPTGTRLELMELYLTAFQDIYASHHHDLRPMASIPLHPEYRAKQENMLKLLNALATGYKVAVVDLVSEKRAHARWLNLALALQRAMYFLGQIVVTAYEVYTQPPSGTWRELHELYRCAEEEDLIDLEVTPMPQHSGSQDVVSSYMSVLVVGASAPLGLLPGEARRLYNLTPRWRSTLKITNGIESLNEPGYFCVNLDADVPPIPLSKAPKPVDEAVRVIKTLGVARDMHETLVAANTATRQPLRNMEATVIDPMDAELFRRAGRVLGEVGVRRASNRFPGNDQLEFCSGFKSVYFVCNNEQPFTPADLAPVDSETPENGQDEEEEQFIDLGEPMIGEPISADASHEPSLTPLGSKEFRYWAEVADQSAGGMCLVLPRTPDMRLKVGDVGACRPTANTDWQLGTVRWMRVGSKEVKCGVQFLGPRALPAAATADTETTSEVHAAIWLPENPILKQPNSILLPRGTGNYPARLRMLGNDEVPEVVRLLGRIDRTGDYEQFLVSLETEAESESNNFLSS